MFAYKNSNRRGEVFFTSIFMEISISAVFIGGIGLYYTNYRISLGGGYYCSNLSNFGVYVKCNDSSGI
jgi:5-formyltetrahydrofolate cyclo-ligase